VAAKSDCQAGRRNGRVAKQDWLAGGMEMLGRRGPGAIRIDAMCAQLGVTKGSFYWHFTDRQAFLGSLLAYWEYKATQAIIERVEASGGAPRSRILSLLQEGLSGQFDFSAELAIRHWARNDRLAAAAVKRVDARRIEFLEGILDEMGFAPDAATTKAIFLYSLNLSQGTIVRREAKGKRLQRLHEFVDLLVGEEAGADG
jgi:AcrR family transcriptional regulator